MDEKIEISILDNQLREKDNFDLESRYPLHNGHFSSKFLGKLYTAEMPKRRVEIIVKADHIGF